MSNVAGSAYPHDVDGVLAAHRAVVFVVCAASRGHGRGAGAAAADCCTGHVLEPRVIHTCLLLTLVLAEGGEAGDAGHVLIVWTRGHVPQRLQLPLRAVVTHVAVEHRGCVGARG